MSRKCRNRPWHTFRAACGEECRVLSPYLTCLTWLFLLPTCFRCCCFICCVGWSWRLWLSSYQFFSLSSSWFLVWKRVLSCLFILSVVLSPFCSLFLEFEHFRRLSLLKQSRGFRLPACVASLHTFRPPLSSLFCLCQGGCSRYSASDALHGDLVFSPSAWLSLKSPPQHACTFLRCLIFCLQSSHVSSSDPGESLRHQTRTCFLSEKLQSPEAACAEIDRAVNSWACLLPWEVQMRASIRIQSNQCLVKSERWRKLFSLCECTPVETHLYENKTK